MGNILNLLFLFLTIAASIGQMLSRNWKWILGSLAIQYLGVFWFVQTIWPVSLAIIKLLAGMIVCLALASSQMGLTSFTKLESSWPQGRTFRVLGVSLVLLVALATTSVTSEWLGINNLPGIFVSIVLVGSGLLQIGFTAQPMRVIIALLTFLSGFEIIYAFMESSTLVAALLVLMNIGLSLVGVYLLRNVETGNQ